jgi:hypothetical protein
MANMSLPLVAFGKLHVGEHFNRQVMEGGKLPVYTKTSGHQATNPMTGQVFDIDEGEKVRSNDGRHLQPFGLQNPLGDKRPASRK